MEKVRFSTSDYQCPMSNTFIFAVDKKLKNSQNEIKLEDHKMKVAQVKIDKIKSIEQNYAKIMKVGIGHD